MHKAEYMILDYLAEYHRYRSILGVFVVLVIAVIFSRHRSHINYGLVCRGLLLHCVLGFIALKTQAGHWCLQKLANGISLLYQYGAQGISFVFGALGVPTAPWNFMFAFHVLPVIIFFGALVNMLFYFGIIQRVVKVIEACVRPLLHTSGPETLCAVANSFLSQTESPLLVRHYLDRMTKSELFVVMVSGMGTISGAILAVYAVMGVPAQHMLAASIMAIPATLIIAKIVYPETEKSEVSQAQDALLTDGTVAGRNVLDAISRGTSDGLSLALNVGAMLIAFIALIALANAMLSGLFSGLSWVLIKAGLLQVALPSFTLTNLFGLLFIPFGWLFGIDILGTIMQVSSLMGTKLAINEMVAYSMLVTAGLSARMVAMVTYALCGFANFSSIGIQLGGIGALVPHRRHEIAELGMRALLSATLANLLSALVAGLFI